MNVCLLLISDGRDDYLQATLKSAVHRLPRCRYLVHVDDRGHELGFAGAIAEGWRQVLETGADWVFHLEQDFTFNRPVPLEHMRHVLATHRELVQLVLKRQPWNPQEAAAGGIVEQDPDSYTERHDPATGAVWTEHRRFFSTNPSLYRARLCERGWPQTEFSEGVFTHRLLEDPQARFAFWGAKHREPWVHHIGDDRAGHGY